MATGGNIPQELSSAKRRAIAALLTCNNVKEAAGKAKVGPRTLYRWLAEDPGFRQALIDAEAGLIDEAGRRLLGGQEQALDTLEGIMTNAPKENDRRLAAAAWLDFCLRWRELRNVEERLAALERMVYNDRR